MDVDLDFVGSVTLTDIYSYMTYLSRDRVRHQNSSPFRLRPERRVPCQKNRHDPLLLQLPDQQDPPTS